MAKSNKKGMNAVTAGVVGAVVGAAAGATAVALSSEKNRKALGKKFSKVKDEVGKMAAGIGAKMEEARKAVKSKV